MDKRKKDTKAFAPAVLAAGIGAVGAIAGGLINSNSQDKANDTNLAQVDKANKFNAQQAVLQREFDQKQVREARRWDKRQVTVAHKRAERNAKGAERRGRRYAKRDLKDYRDYNSPEATRARMEAAGLNPAGVTDTSGGYMPGAGSITPAGAGAAASGIAPGAFAEMIPGHVQATNWGDGIIQGFQSYADGLYAQEELELRATQLDQENERLTAMMQRATMRPTVPGIYGGRGGSFGGGSNRFIPEGDPRRGPAGDRFGDREYTLDPTPNLPALADIETGRGRTVFAINPDLDLEGPAAWLNSGWIAGNTVFDEVRHDYGRMSGLHEKFGGSKPHFELDGMQVRREELWGGDGVRTDMTPRTISADPTWEPNWELKSYDSFPVYQDITR